MKFNKLALIALAALALTACSSTPSEEDLNVDSGEYQQSKNTSHRETMNTTSYDEADMFEEDLLYELF